MRVESLTLKNIGPFDQLDLTFKNSEARDKAEIHLFVGDTGTGKSTVLYALASLFRNFDSGPPDPALSFRLRMEETPAYSAVIDGKEYYERFKKLGPNNFSSDASFPHPVFKEGKRDFAAFAYSGTHASENGTFEPLAGALSFSRALDVDALREWAVQHPRGAQSLDRIANLLGALGGPTYKIKIEGRALRFVTPQGRALPFEALPGGARAVLGWAGDLLMRLERLEWHGRARIIKRPFLLLLDEIDTRLHPRWQRLILPMLQRLFPNAQIFASTHSPLVAASVSDAWVHRLETHFLTGIATLRDSTPARAGYSLSYVLENQFGIVTDFDAETELEITRLLGAIQKVLNGRGTLEKEVLPLAEQLSGKSLELASLVGCEVIQLRQRLAERQKKPGKRGRKR